MNENRALDSWGAPSPTAEKGQECPARLILSGRGGGESQCRWWRWDAPRREAWSAPRSPGLLQVRRRWGAGEGGRWPVPLGGQLPSRSSFSRDGPEGVGGPLFPGTLAPPSPPQLWVGEGTGGSELSPGPGRTPVREGAEFQECWFTRVYPVCTQLHVSHTWRGFDPVLRTPFPGMPGVCVCVCVCVCVLHTLLH
jgi:hypothetical protein